MKARRATTKPAATRKRRSPDGKMAVAGILERLKAEELAAVLKALLERHPDLRGEAGKLAIESLSSPSIDRVADGVCTSVTNVDIEALSGRAGKKSWGYVEPSEAACELLQEALDDIIADMKRRMELGLVEAAESMCRGIVLGLYKAKGVRSDGVLGWALDFPAEEACHAVAEFFRACPTEKRKFTRNRLLAALAGDVSDWSEMLARAAKPAVSRK